MLSLQQIEAAAPDQASLKAASKLMKPAKWPLRRGDDTSGLIWGECQGSGANPYRVMADRNDLGAKCTCPSRKFPCKHALALLWMYSESSESFEADVVPEWVSDWVGRRRKTTAQAPSQPSRATGKSITTATEAESEPVVDEKTIARRAAAAEKRRVELIEGVRSATLDLEQWISDQLRTGLSAFLNDPTERCRRIAARMVDAKAQALAGRIDELPAGLMALRSEERLDAVISELGKLVLLVRAWRADPEDPELFRSVISTETREQILESADALSVEADWEVLNDRVTTRRDGLVSQATWLLNLDETGSVTPAYALLLDFFPAGAGRRTAPFQSGEQFHAVLRFYPARRPLRALIAERSASASQRNWPEIDPKAHPFDQLHAFRDAAPWGETTPLHLPAGRIGEANGRPWWKSLDGDAALPLLQKPDRYAMGAILNAGMGLWDKGRLDLLAAHSGFGRLSFDA